MDSSSYGKLVDITNLFKRLTAQIDAEFPLEISQPLDVPPTTPPTLSLDIPTPSALVHKLVALGAPTELALELSRVHSTRATNLADQYQAAYSKSCLSLSRIYGTNNPEHHAALVTRLRKQGVLFSDKLLLWETEVHEMVRTRCVRDSPPPRSRKTEKRKALFNQQFAPALEAFFVQNQFPSRADRCLLAKKSGMTLDQITNWFQNHRTRLRKQGKADASDRDITPSISGGDLQRSLSPSHETEFPDDEPTDVDEPTQTWSRSSSFTLVGEEDSLSFNPPSYAFPAPFDPDVSKRLSAHRNFCKIHWMRTPVAVLVPCPARENDIDVDQLASLFGDMHINNPIIPSVPTSSIAFGMERERPTEGFDVTSFVTIRPLPAPLPSFIRRPEVCRLHSTLHCAPSSPGRRRRGYRRAPSCKIEDRVLSCDTKLQFQLGPSACEKSTKSSSDRALRSPPRKAPAFARRVPRSFAHDKGVVIPFEGHQPVQRPTSIFVS